MRYSHAQKWSSRQDFSILLLMLLYALCLLLIGSTDGFLREPTLRGDNAWFYMSGKAWMEGMVPYVDFSDSKGPLIWLLYGIGYIISPYKYTGLFLFEIVFYWLNFYVLYRAAFLVLNNRAQAVLASMLMAIFYFYPALHTQMRLEDFCHLFHSVVFYVLLQIIVKGHYRAKYAVYLGISCGSMLMMKYSYFIDTSMPCGILLVYFICKREYSRSFRYVLWYMAGIIAVCLPFILYLGAIGAFNAFFNEYFFKTGQTIVNLRALFDGQAGDITHKWPFKIWYLYRIDHFLSEFMRYVFVGLCFTFYYFRKYPWLLVALLSWYIPGVLMFSMLDGEAYYLTLSIFAFGGLIWLASLFKKLNMPTTIMTGAVMLYFLAYSTVFYVYSEFYFVERDREGRANMEEVGDIINAWERTHGRPATITWYGNSDRGEDLKTNALPGTKYWSAQAGMTEEMKREHIEDIFFKRPDFVVAEKTDTVMCRRLSDNDYELVKEYVQVPPYKPGIRVDTMMLYMDKRNFNNM